MSLLANLAVALGASLTGVSVLLMVLGLLAYQRVGQSRMLWISGAFALFAALGVVHTWDAWQNRGDPSLPPEPLLALAIVAALYVAVLKKS